MRDDLTGEAIRLDLLIRALMPDDGEVARAAGADVADRSAPDGPRFGGRRTRHSRRSRTAGMDAALIAEGHRLVRERLATGVAPGRYQILAAINAVHTSARTYATPTGRRSSPSTTSLSASTPRRSSPSTGPSRSPSLDGPEVALAAVDRLEDKLAGYHAIDATLRRPAAPAGLQPEVARGVRQSHRAGGQHRRDGLPDTPPRPAGIVPLPV